MALLRCDHYKHLREWCPATQRYIDLAGVLFRDEAEAAEARISGRSMAV
jgi:hypothetical protein